MSHDRTVLAIAYDGFVHGGPDQGLLVDETRLLSRYRWLVGGQAPFPVALSNVEQRSWLGYYISSPPGAGHGRANIAHPKEAAQQTLEIRPSRSVSGGVHEDIDVTNFAQRELCVELALEVDVDFADQEELSGKRQQRGAKTCTCMRWAMPGNLPSTTVRTIITSIRANAVWPPYTAASPCASRMPPRRLGLAVSCRTSS